MNYKNVMTVLGVIALICAIVFGFIPLIKLI